MVTKLAPLAAGGAMAFTIGQYGIGKLAQLGFLLGCVVAVGASLVQYGSPDNMEGFIAFMVICPAPAIVVGIIMLTVCLLQARQGQIEER